jgi:hypothetical protein
MEHHLKETDIEINNSTPYVFAAKVRLRCSTKSPQDMNTQARLRTGQLTSCRVNFAAAQTQLLKKGRIC